MPVVDGGEGGLEQAPEIASSVDNADDLHYIDRRIVDIRMDCVEHPACQVGCLPAAFPCVGT